VDKVAVRDVWLARIRSDLDALKNSQKATQDGATHAESRSEHPKDTRAIESSYLARGLAERVVDLEQALITAGLMELKDFDSQSSIGLSALFSLEDQHTGVESHYFLTSVAGGIRLAVGDLEILSLTTQSPLGRAVSGRHLEDEVLLKIPQGDKEFVIRRLR
jgi:transcription elongation GreA/GreB family factor